MNGHFIVVVLYNRLGCMSSTWNLYNLCSLWLCTLQRLSNWVSGYIFISLSLKIHHYSFLLNSRLNNFSIIMLRSWSLNTLYSWCIPILCISGNSRLIYSLSLLSVKINSFIIIYNFSVMNRLCDIFFSRCIDSSSFNVLFCDCLSSSSRVVNSFSLSFLNIYYLFNSL